MNLARTRRGAAAPRQCGFALIAILALAAMIAAFLIAIGMNRSSAEISNEREDKSMSALRQAKAALIAYAASEVSQSGYFQPGSLPCPDKDNDDGSSDCTGSTARSMIGRLPFRTLNIDDLRDSSGERLWYAVSQDFRKMQCPTANCTTINSDTQGQLSVTGAISANNVVAVVIAPGLVVQGQTRPTTPTAAAHNDPANYVESFTSGDWVHFTFTTNAFPTDTLNDRLLVITQADVMAAVEPVVAANIERDIASSILTYVGNYGVYPFPVSFDPTRTPQSAYLGSTSQTQGMLPLTRTAVQWDPSSISITHLVSGDSGNSPPDPPPTVTSMDCSASTSSQISCRVDYCCTGNDRPAIQIQATLKNAGRAFPDLLDITSVPPATTLVNMININGGVLQTTAFGYWTASGSPQFVPTVSNVMLQNGDAVVTIQGRLQNADPVDGTGGRVTITILPPSYLKFTDGTDPTYGWFVANEWYRQTYYAVSPGWLPNSASIYGATSCHRGGTPVPPCLSVANLRPSYTIPDDKRAILVLAGRSLDGSRPPASSNPAAYFENANLTAANNPTTTFAFENRLGNPTSINDRVVVVSP